MQPSVCAHRRDVRWVVLPQVLDAALGRDDVDPGAVRELSAESDRPVGGSHHDRRDVCGHSDVYPECTREVELAVGDAGDRDATTESQRSPRHLDPRHRRLRVGTRRRFCVGEIVGDEDPVTGLVDAHGQVADVIRSEQERTEVVDLDLDRVQTVDGVDERLSQIGEEAQFGHRQSGVGEPFEGFPGRYAQCLCGVVELFDSLLSGHVSSCWVGWVLVESCATKSDFSYAALYEFHTIPSTCKCTS